MADIFVKRDTLKLLAWKHILMIGDSNMRALYKDLVCLLSCGKLLTLKQLRAKGEVSFLGDTRTKFMGLNRTRDFVEDRHKLYRDEESGDCVRVEFMFTTKVYNKSIIERFTSPTKDLPDIILINSTLWDLTRWGPEGDIQFKSNLLNLVKLFKDNLSPTTTVVWLTAQHLSSRETTTALVVKELDFLKTFLQYHVMEANNYAATIMRDHGFNVLDAHYYSRLLNYRRRPDGVHYNCTVVRFLTNLILTHLALQLNVKLPGRQTPCEITAIKDGVRTTTEGKEDVRTERNENDTTVKTLDNSNNRKNVITNNIEKTLRITDDCEQNVKRRKLDITDNNEKYPKNASLLDMNNFSMKQDHHKESRIDIDGGTSQCAKGPIRNITDSNRHAFITKTVDLTLNITESSEIIAIAKTFDNSDVNENDANRTKDDINDCNEENDNKVNRANNDDNGHDNITKEDTIEKTVHINNNDDNSNDEDRENDAMKKNVAPRCVNEQYTKTNVDGIEQTINNTDDNGQNSSEKKSDIPIYIAQDASGETVNINVVIEEENIGKTLDIPVDIVQNGIGKISKSTDDNGQPEPPRKILRARRRLQTMVALNTRANLVLNNTVDDLMNEIDFEMDDFELGWFSVFGPNY